MGFLNERRKLVHFQVIRGLFVQKKLFERELVLERIIGYIKNVLRSEKIFSIFFVRNDQFIEKNIRPFSNDSLKKSKNSDEIIEIIQN